MNVSAVRKGIADAITAGVASSVGLTAYWFVPDGVSVPCFFVKPDEITFDRTMGRGLDEITFDVVVYVSRADDLAAQERLDAFLSGSGPSSFKAAIEARRRLGTNGKYLGDVCDDLRVETGKAYQHYAHGDTTYLGGQLAVRAYGSGT